MSTYASKSRHRLARSLALFATGFAGIALANVAPDPAHAQASICERLELRLAEGWVSRSRPRSDDGKPSIEDQIRKLDRQFNKLRHKLDRTGCYEQAFIFGRTLRNVPRCRRMHREMERTRSKLSRLQRRKTSRGQDTRAKRNEQDQLIFALARNKCGAHYEREARRRGGNNLFGWGDDGGGFLFGRREPRPDPGLKQVLPFATYRTLCVRLCDGYYFPISFSTVPSRFRTDQAKCQSSCAAPAQLFVYRNPGGTVEQMISTSGNKPYSEIPNAFRYRKEYVAGCTCNEVALDADGAGTDGKGTPDPAKRGSGTGERTEAPVTDGKRSADAGGRTVDPTTTGSIDDLRAGRN